MNVSRRDFPRSTGRRRCCCRATDWRSPNPRASPMNPVELAVGEGHLRPIDICMQPSQNDRDTRIVVVRVAA